MVAQGELGGGDSLGHSVSQGDAGSVRIRTAKEITGDPGRLSATLRDGSLASSSVLRWLRVTSDGPVQLWVILDDLGDAARWQAGVVGAPLPPKPISHWDESPVVFRSGACGVALSSLWHTPRPPLRALFLLGSHVAG